MDLTEEHKQKVASWIADGVGLSDVQERLKNDFDISMTYMDVRFLVDDLDLDLVDEEEEVPEEEAPAEGATDASAVTDANAELVGGAVSVEVDKVQRPGAVVSGSVAFSDGEKCAWQVDPMGRLGIIPSKEGYKPSDEDMQAFQEQLHEELQKKGF